MHPVFTAAHALIRISGPDAQTFLQGQLTQELARLGPAALLRSGFNNPQGRVLALPWVFERDAIATLVLPAELAAPTAERLRRFVLRAKVKIALVGEDELACVPVAARLEKNAPVPGHRRLAAVSALDFDNRTLLVGPAAELEHYLGTLGHARATPADWALACIRAGDPEISLAGSEHWVAQMLNLDLLDGISFAKGCYTGQEIIARTQHLGRIKRRTFRYRGGESPLPAVREPLYAGGAKVGEVLLAAPAEAGLELLAVVSLEARNQRLATAAGLELEPLALPYAVG